MTTSAFPAYVDALKTALEARPALANVIIASGPLGDQTPRGEGIVVIGCEDDIDWDALGQQKQKEQFTITGVLWSVQPGAGETEIKEARDRCSALLTEVQTALTTDTQVTSTVQHSRVSFTRWRQGTQTDGRVCLVDFDITCRNRI